uniref:Centrosomal protein of 162 kDa n=1 Tax=Mesocestoides corti TaxID=53468 RepID=A0A5K3FGE8_MESCO
MLDSAYANVDALSTELHATKLQLSSKCEAIKILTQRLEETKKEAEQFKLMAEQLQERYRSLKQTLGSDVSSSPSVNCPPRKAFINLKVKLNESEMHNRILETELNNIRRRNSELLNDIAVLQKSCARSQPEAFENSSNEKKSFSAQERESLIAQLELKTMEVL